ncbi:UDP-glucose/GDP-mannose dehydrogenase family protein [Kytococcus sedentarius]|uniref:UDP-glucose 6-dehydrogenase n=1 Tax=Kytococcus sedentarius (strain ATCC 14392 / DSM 20547 / JCM 11482 / CCUG 33030 / NBRC 15357 / NCTC 11040 / CCM 314 / 541) TaxID=478801 RepID=C7NGW4_KYTSD|nr:UDP-glucose/GDP-mannose dehydrogenase family protein [Kytococcus sedentarius]ACV07636.1 nucleotide sugar dehydrogenase [Kytococcus sedentarius DSM 20547]QQB63563.1 UDP-glucose/GDP-mannose dehydrogenase family protein [Kytococcus sedentarius]STX13513.1 UDP-glucose 6-dehydrogenase ywqF [Kytococcus sedentarius]
MRVAVIGTGYLGAVHAAGMAQLGFQTVGVDVDQAKVDRLQAGTSPFYEPDFEPILAEQVASGRLRFTTDFSQISDADVVFIGVGTPQKADSHAADLTYIDAAIASITPHLKDGALVAGKSTVPVGTAQRLAEYIAEHTADGVTAELAWNPEFLREGFAVQDTLHPDRLVFGVTSDRAESILREVYARTIEQDGTPVVVTDLPTAELVKVAANSFLATKISFINAMAEICEFAGADVTKLADAIGHDDRIGRKFLNAGVGFGGGCLPKDIRAFSARAGELGAGHALEFLAEIDKINSRRRDHVVELAKQELGGDLRDRKVAVLGASFKPNSDDVRDSPALAVAGALHLAGADVRVYDPKGMENAAKVYPPLTYADSAEAAIADAELVVHLTEWQEFKDLDPAVLVETVGTPTIIDGRNALDPVAWRAAGWTYIGLGRP